jgi:hypothetical protein
VLSHQEMVRVNTQRLGKCVEHKPHDKVAMSMYHHGTSHKDSGFAQRQGCRADVMGTGNLSHSMLVIVLHVCVFPEYEPSELQTMDAIWTWRNKDKKLIITHSGHDPVTTSLSLPARQVLGKASHSCYQWCIQEDLRTKPWAETCIFCFWEAGNLWGFIALGSSSFSRLLRSRR